MLYTGGTTGMPKGVIYAMGGTTASFVESSFPVFGLTPTADAARDRPDGQGDVSSAASTRVSIPCAPLMHGTGVWIGAMMPHLGGACVVTLTSRSLDPAELLGTIQREQAVDDHHRRRRLLQAAPAPSSTGPSEAGTPVRPVQPQGGHLQRGDVDRRRSRSSCSNGSRRRC